MVTRRHLVAPPEHAQTPRCRLLFSWVDSTLRFLRSLRCRLLGSGAMTEAAPVVRRPGSMWKLALRIVVSGALLAVVVSKASSVDDAIPDQHGALTISLLVAAVLAALVGVVLSAWRWQRVLLLFDVRVPVPALFSHYVVGLLVGNVLPSTIGGDVVRIARASNTVG